MRRIIALCLILGLLAIPTLADTESSPLMLEKFVGYGGAWFTADSEPGISVPVGQAVTYRLLVKNLSESDTLTGLTLTDNLYPIDDCTIPTELAAGQSFECVVGPITAEADGAVTNVALATATTADGTLLTATDSAVVTHNEVEGELTSVEGIIEAIDGVIVTVGGVAYTIPADDPVLPLLEVGDNVLIVGVQAEDGTFTVHLITLLDEDVYIDTDEDEDDGDEDDEDDFRENAPCHARPPDWAPAYGWRMKCDPDSLENFILPPGQAKKLNRGGEGEDEDDAQAHPGNGRGKKEKKDKGNNGNGNGRGNGNGNGRGNGNGNGRGNGKN